MSARHNRREAPKLLDGGAMQGSSWRPLLAGGAPLRRPDFMYQYCEFPGAHCVRPHRGVRDGRWKYIRWNLAPAGNCAIAALPSPLPGARKVERSRCGAALPRSTRSRSSTARRFSRSSPACGGGREGGRPAPRSCAFRNPFRRRKAPQPGTIRSTSSSSAAAVTSAPAPGPWITSGRSR